jgi:carbon-monoxide dehydrogenase large subunit
MDTKYVGKSEKRVDAFAKVTGAGTYVADVKLPRMVYAKVLRAGVAHAKIRSIDISQAQAMPGILKVITGKGCKILFGTCLWDQPPLAVDKVRHAGEPVAVAVAQSPAQAQAALGKIKVEYEALPFVLDPIEAASKDAPLVHEKNGEYRRVEYVVHSEKGTNIFQHYKLRKGDIKKGFSEAEVTVEEDFEFPLSNHCALEPHGAICRFLADGSIEMWASNQAPFVLRDVLADMFGVPAARIRVHIPYLGGGFGGKSDVSIEPLTAYVASFVPGYAVKLILSRQEVFTSSLLGRGMKGKMKIGAKRDGTLVALEAALYFSDGAYGDTSWPVVTVAGHNCTGPYEFPNCKVDAYGIYTNSPPVGAYRGYGHPEGQFMSSRLMDILARKLKMKPQDLMRKNFLSAGKKNALGQTITKSHGDIGRCLDIVTKAVFKNGKPGEDDRYIYGRGVAAMMKSPKMAANSSSGCDVKINGDGSVFVNLAGVEMGQGCQTVFTQMASEVLQVPLEKVSVYRDIDTQFAPWDWQTVASMQTYRGGRAIIQACQRAIEVLKSNAAEAFQCPVEEIEYDEGGCFRKGQPKNKLSLGSLARGYMQENGLTVGVPVATSGSYRVQGLTEPHPETGMGNAAGSWTFGCQAAEIRIDKSSGKLEVLHYASAFDIGKVINPKTCRGQIVGGVVQGLGATLMEKIEFTEKGTVKNANFNAYKIPTIDDMPKKLSVKFVETPNKEGPWSAKPIAEHPIVAVAPTILNAIYDAIGYDFYRIPVTPDEILKAMGRKEQ